MSTRASSTQSISAASIAAAAGPAADESDFAAVLQSLQPGLRRYMRRQLADTDMAEDAVQEAFLHMLRYRQCGNAGEIRALLFRVAANVVADHRRQAHTRQRDRHCDMEQLELVSPEPQPDRMLSDRQSLDCVKEAIRGLPPRCRHVFLLHRFEGLGYRDIARQLGISERTVENQIAHALAICRKALGENRRRAFK